MSSDDISVDSDVAFAFVDFSGVDFGGKSTCDGDGDGDEKCFGTILDQDEDEDTDNILKYAKKAATARKVSLLKQQSFPGGQDPEEEHEHNPEIFKAQVLRTENLVKWYELGIRPDQNNLNVHTGKDDDLFEAKTDDLSKLLLRSCEAQDEVNRNLPPPPLTDHERDKHLRVATSTIEDAGNGLFTTVFISKGTVVCHYTGYRHHYQSQKRLKNRAYVLKLQNGWPKHDRRNDGFVDALPCKRILARYINDPREEDKCNVKFEHIKEPGVWHCPVVAQRDILAGEELFISYGPRYWEESRMIGG